MPFLTNIYLFFAGLLAPHSATVSPNQTVADETSYYCQAGVQAQAIHIQLGKGSKGLPCQVILQKEKQMIQLLKANRNVDTCNVKARTMALRLKDRGWRCEKQN
jgi:hypothetical protein